MAQQRPLTTRRRIGLLPMRERFVAVALLGCSLLPPGAILVGRFAASDDDSFLVLLGQRPALAVVLAALMAVLVLFLWERPRALSPAAYGAQLRQRLQEVQAVYHRALARQQEEHPDADPDAVDPQQPPER